jgi:putative ABC transport system permease protein
MPGRRLISPVGLAWRQLRHQSMRLLVAIAGVSFAVILMLMQLGFAAALYASGVRLHETLRGEVVLISPVSLNISGMRSFPRVRLFQTLGIPGVASASALYSAIPVWKNLDTGRNKDILLLGIDPNQDVLDLPGLTAAPQLLRQPDVVLFDSASRPEYGPVADAVAGGRTLAVEVNNRRVEVAGLFRLGTSFGYDGTVITSELNFQRIMPSHAPEVIEIGLLRLHPGADPRAVREAVDAALPADVEVLTKDQYIERETRYWADVTPIGFITSFGALMGFVVGSVIVYQILFADVSDHLSEYATLKAVGHTDLYLAGVVVSQAVMLAVLGFLPGVGVAHRLYRLTEDATQLPMRLSPDTGLLVLGLTILMCSLAGMLALRKVQSADPAEIF